VFHMLQPKSRRLILTDEQVYWWRGSGCHGQIQKVVNACLHQDRKRATQAWEIQKILTIKLYLTESEAESETPSCTPRKPRERAGEHTDDVRMCT
jgi:hypothetical protein